MQVSLETTRGLERRMRIAVPKDRVDSAVDARLRETARTVHLKGFRKGKVPLKVVKNKFGAGVRQEVVGEIMSRTYNEALRQQSLRPAGQPKIEPTQMGEDQDLEFIATFEVYPEIKLPDFTKIKVDRLHAEITEDDIDDMVETLRKQRQTWTDAERPAAGGDLVNIDYAGTVAGEEFEGGSARGANLVLGSERMIPGFEEGIVGKQAGDAFTLSLTFPEEYRNEALAGKAVDFHLTLNHVKGRTLPPVNEEFFASFGVEEGGEKTFREEIAGNMKRELKTASHNKLKNRIMDALIAMVEVEAPAALVAAEVQGLRQQAVQQMGGRKVDPALLPDELFREQANRRVLLGLVLGEVIQRQNIQADPVRVRESVEEIASTYESPAEVIKWYYSNKEQLAEIESTVVEDQVFDYIVEQARITDKTVSYREVIKPEPRDEQTKAAGTASS